MAKVLIAMPEVAERLGVSRQRAHRLAIDGRLRSVKVLGRRGVYQEDLDLFAAQERNTGRPKSNGSNGKAKKKGK